MTTDFDSFFRNRIEGLLIRASWVAALRTMLGLEGVSQIWNGNAAWYLWLHKAPGVYALVFSEGDAFTVANSRLCEGQFALKCYPYPDHPGFEGFSAEERRLIQSQDFDDTHTPQFEAASVIPESLFTVGSLSLICDAEDTLALLTYQSLDRLRIRQWSEPTTDTRFGPEGKTPTHPLRDVAGWALGYPLFDCLVGLHAHSRSAPPDFIGISRSQGFEYTVSADGHFECHPSRRVMQTALTIGFHGPDQDTGQIESLWRSRLDADETILSACKLPVSIENSVAAHWPDPIVLNSLWWEIAGADFKSELASTCGCGEPCRHHRDKHGACKC
jgi:hypothetical protein